MIKIVAKDLPDQIVTPTMFPDGTSQVWKLELEQYKQENTVKILWNFEQEAELIWVHQLYDLLLTNDINVSELYIPYLPYARQDKAIDNLATFAKATFINLLPFVGAGKITTLDCHSEEHNIGIESYSATPYINKAIKESAADVLVFPDKGAYTRYGRNYAGLYEIMILDKVRDQLTGNITGLGFSDDYSNIRLMDELIHETQIRFLIIDDISDYGGTFKKASKFLKATFKDLTAIRIGLYVTHFLGHGDLSEFARDGIDDIYTTDSLSAYWNHRQIKMNDSINVFGLFEQLEK